MLGDPAIKIPFLRVIRHSTSSQVKWVNRITMSLGGLPQESSNIAHVFHGTFKYKIPGQLPRMQHTGEDKHFLNLEHVCVTCAVHLRNYSHAHEHEKLKTVLRVHEKWCADPPEQEGKRGMFENDSSLFCRSSWICLFSHRAWTTCRKSHVQVYIFDFRSWSAPWRLQVSSARVSDFCKYDSSVGSFVNIFNGCPLDTKSVWSSTWLCFVLINVQIVRKYAGTFMCVDIKFLGSMSCRVSSQLCLPSVLFQLQNDSNSSIHSSLNKVVCTIRLLFEKNEFGVFALFVWTSSWLEPDPQSNTWVWSPGHNNRAWHDHLACGKV